MKQRKKKDAIFRKQFANGLTLVSERTRGSHAVTVGFWVRTGTRHEARSEVGISHLLEHMLFKGTEKNSALDLVKKIERVGGEFNAFTAREYTCFHITVLSKDLSLALELLTDVLMHSQFDAEELERERKVILQEVAMVEESPEELVSDFHQEYLWPSHGLGRNILGSDRSIRRIRRAQLLRYFRRHYTPDQMLITVNGDVAPAVILKKLARILKSKNWPGRGESTQSPKNLGFEPAPPIRDGFWWVKRPTEQVHIVLGVPAPKYSSRDRLAALLLSNTLGGGMSSTLFQEIREQRGMAYTVYSQFQPYSDTGVLTVYAATTLRKVPLCLQLIEEALARVCRELLTEEELSWSKESLEGSWLLASDDPETKMTLLARNELFLGRHESMEQVCDEIQKITAQDLRRVARKCFGKGQRTIVCLGPKPTASVRRRLKTLGFRFQLSKK